METASSWALIIGVCALPFLTLWAKRAWTRVKAEHRAATNYPEAERSARSLAETPAAGVDVPPTVHFDLETWRPIDPPR